MHLIAVFFQVVLDAALEEVQLGLQLLREAEHAVLTPGQVGVVAQETQPGEGRRRQSRVRKVWKEEQAPQQQMSWMNLHSLWCG